MGRTFDAEMGPGYRGDDGAVRSEMRKKDPSGGAFFLPFFSLPDAWSEVDRRAVYRDDGSESDPASV